METTILFLCRCVLVACSVTLNLGRVMASHCLTILTHRNQMPQRDSRMLYLWDERLDQSLGFMWHHMRYDSEFVCAFLWLMRGWVALYLYFECLYAWNLLFSGIFPRRLSNDITTRLFCFVYTEPRGDNCHKLRDCALYHRAMVPVERIGRAPHCAVRNSLFHGDMESLADDVLQPRCNQSKCGKLALPAWHGSEFYGGCHSSFVCQVSQEAYDEFKICYLAADAISRRSMTKICR